MTIKAIEDRVPVDYKENLYHRVYFGPQNKFFTDKDIGSIFVRTYPITNEFGVHDYSYVPDNLDSASIQDAAIEFRGIEDGKFRYKILAPTLSSLYKRVIEEDAKIYDDGRWAKATTFTSEVNVIEYRINRVMREKDFLDNPCCP